MNPEASEAKILRFDGFDLDLASAELRKNGEPVKLQPQPARVLALLVRSRGRLVTRDEIRQQIWGDHTFVDFEQGLNFCIKQIRAALGDDAEKPRYIETLPRRGYRFLVSVEELAGAPAAETQGAVRETGGFRFWALTLASILILSAAAILIWRPSWFRRQGAGGRILIAVLPFQNLSGDAEQEYLSDGMTEEMITQLGGYSPQRFGVIARTSAMQYKHADKTVGQIGKELGVDYALEGSVRRAGDRVRISAQLIRVRDQTHLWAQTYERGIRDVLALQAEVARAIALEIDVQLRTPDRVNPAAMRQVKPDAYEAYLKGRYYCRTLTGAGVAKGIENLKRAIEEDPGYAPAHAALAEAYYALSNMQLNPREAMTQAKAEAAKALELDDSLAEAHAALGVVKAFYEWDWAGADAEFKRALDLDPAWAGAQGWYGAYLALMGRLDESRAELERARRLDPLSLSINSTMSLPLFLAGRYDEVIDQMHRALELDPGFYLAHVSLGIVHESKGEFDKAIEEFMKARQVDDSPEILALLGHTYALSGRKAEAESVIAQLQGMSKTRYVSPYDIALVYAGLGEKDQALKWLQRAYETRSEGMTNLKTDSRLNGLRSDPQFQNLLRLMNFPK